MPTTHNDVQQPGHNARKWKQVRKRAMLQQTTQDDWEGCNTEQRYFIHQVELAIASIIADGIEVKDLT